ncbi:hypothetical protein BH10PSE9_BH10PSE9_10270 [soil metagenome]
MAVREFVLDRHWSSGHDMMTLLALLLALDAALHGFLIYRFGVSDRANIPFLVFAFVDAALAIAVFFVVPHALWATLVLSAVGLVGLTVTFNKPNREKSLDRIIWVVDLAIVLFAAYLLFVR